MVPGCLTLLTSPDSPRRGTGGRLPCLSSEVRCTSGFFSGVGVAARIGFSERTFGTFSGHFPSNKVELFSLYRLVVLSTFLATPSFFDVLDISENSDIFGSPFFFDIGPFYGAVSVFFEETSLILESLTPVTGFY